METARHLVSRGIGVGFFPRALVAEDLQRDVLVELEVHGMPPVTRESALLRRLRAGPLSPAATRLVALLRTEAERLGLVAISGGGRELGGALTDARRSRFKTSRAAGTARKSPRR